MRISFIVLETAISLNLFGTMWVFMMRTSF